MRRLVRNEVIAGLCLWIHALTVGCAATQQPTSRPLDIAGEDAARIADLHSRGTRIEGALVVVWFPRDSLPESHMRALADSLDAAIPMLQAFLGGPHPWQRIGGGRITYYYGPGRFISHARDGAVHIPLWRVRQGGAPHLHETAHVLLSPPPPHYPWEFADSAEAERASRIRPLWLIEGLPDLAAKTVAAALRFDEGDIPQTGGPNEVDTICAERLGNRRAAKLLPYLGGAGTPAALFTTERAEVAPVFYACAHSFTRFLAGEVGAPFLASLFPHIPAGEFEARIQERVGRTLPALRAEWLGRIKARSESAAER